MSVTPKNPAFIHRCRWLKAHGFGLGEIAKLTGHSTDEVYLVLTGRKKKQSGAKPIEQHIAELIADVPEGRDPADHRRIVEMNFAGAV